MSATPPARTQSATSASKLRSATKPSISSSLPRKVCRLQRNRTRRVVPHEHRGTGRENLRRLRRVWSADGETEEEDRRPLLRMLHELIGGWRAGLWVRVVAGNGGLPVW